MQRFIFLFETTAGCTVEASLFILLAVVLLDQFDGLLAVLAQLLQVVFVVKDVQH